MAEGGKSNQSDSDSSGTDSDSILQLFGEAVENAVSKGSKIISTALSKDTSSDDECTDDIVGISTALIKKVKGSIKPIARAISDKEEGSQQANKEELKELKQQIEKLERSQQQEKKEEERLRQQEREELEELRQQKEEEERLQQEKEKEERLRQKERKELEEFVQRQHEELQRYGEQKREEEERLRQQEREELEELRQQQKTEERSRQRQRQDAYTMLSKPCGLALVINISKFDSTKSRMQERKGSDEDVKLMDTLLRKLHFHVLCYSNLTAQQIKTMLHDLANRRNVDPILEQVLQNSDCLVVFLMSHGQKDVICGHDGGKVRVNELFEYFYEDRCEYLKGKPKLFFLQACRGVMADLGSVQHDSPECEIDHGAVSNTGIDEDNSLKISQPKTANMLISYSSVENFSSYRHTEIGSWFVREIYDVFSQYAEDMHILELLTKVTEGVGGRSTSTPPYKKQCPQFTSTLTRNLYFNP